MMTMMGATTMTTMGAMMMMMGATTTAMINYCIDYQIVA
jgi:hypothetical protein